LINREDLKLETNSQDHWSARTQAYIDEMISIIWNGHTKPQNIIEKIVAQGYLENRSSEEIVGWLKIKEIRDCITPERFTHLQRLVVSRRSEG